MLNFKIEKDEEYYHAWCPELKGCHTHGKTYSEALKNLKDAVNLYLGDLLEESLMIQSEKMNENVIDL